MQSNNPENEPARDLIPSLRQWVDVAGLNEKKLSVMLLASDQGRIRVDDRHSIPISDGSKVASWSVPSLTELFRGNKAAPTDLKYYPPDYVVHFYFIELSLLTACKALRHDPTDQEMEEIFATLRRRPEGRSLGPLHDYVWQVAALWLGLYVISEEEYAAVFDQLTSSTRKFGLRPVSRHYTAYLHQTFGQLTKA